MPNTTAKPPKVKRAGAEEKHKEGKFQVWEFEAYKELDEAVPNWKDMFIDVFGGFEVYVSPMHNSNCTAQSRGVLMVSRAYKTKEQISELLKQIIPSDSETGAFIGVSDVMPSSPQNVSERLRAFIHADPDGNTLPQYNPDDFYLVGTADPIRRIKWTRTEEDLYAQNMMDYARKHNIQSLNELYCAFADSRIYTHMLSQSRISTKLERHFKQLEQAKISDMEVLQSGMVCFLLGQLLEQSKEIHRLQEQLSQLLTMQYEYEKNMKEHKEAESCD